MRDDRVITLFDWQKVPSGYSAPRSVLYMAVDIEPKVGSILYTLLNRKSRELA